VTLERQLREAGFEPEGPIWVDAPHELGAVVTEPGAFLGWLDVMWPRVWQPERVLRDVAHLPRHSPGNIGAAINQVRRRRSKALGHCSYCGGDFVPGHMDSRDVCQGCAERHLGVVY
jgi:hypothetical protein